MTPAQAGIRRTRSGGREARHLQPEPAPAEVQPRESLNSKLLSTKVFKPAKGAPLREAEGAQLPKPVCRVLRRGRETEALLGLEVEILQTPGRRVIHGAKAEA